MAVSSIPEETPAEETDQPNQIIYWEDDSDRDYRDFVESHRP